MLLVYTFICLAAYKASAGSISPATYEAESYRLPENIMPMHYDLHIDVSKSFANDDLVEKEFKGSVSISAITFEDISRIRLHANDMQIVKSIVLYDEKEIAHNAVFLNTHQFLDLELNEVIPKEKKIKIDIEYIGRFQDSLFGFFIGTYKLDGKNQFVAQTQFEPTHARSAFPCFDEPHYKAIFTISIKRPAQYHSLSNMKQNFDRSDELTDVYENSPRMSAYLVAFVVSKFYYTTAPESLKFKAWASPDKADQTEFLSNVTVHLIEQMEEMTGIKYFDAMGMTKLDQVAVPKFLDGGMENWGLIIYNSKVVLVEGVPIDPRSVTMSAAHEISHQWFGDYVTTKWWSNLWLNEGFATYFGYRVSQKLLTDFDMDAMFVQLIQQAIMTYDKSKTGEALNQNVQTPDEILKHFSVITYMKGACIVRMLEKFIGYETFRSGLKKYLKTNAFTTTVANDLWYSMESAIIESKDPTNNFPAPLEDIMANWINTPGYPVVTVTQNGNIVTFKQEPIYGNSGEVTPEDRWFVPISYTTSKEQDFVNTKPKFWLTPSDEQIRITLDAGEDLSIVNIKESGYYKVNYNTKILRKIINTLNSEEGKKIHPINRAQILDNVKSLTEYEKLNQSVFSDVFDFLTFEEDYYIWYSAIEIFKHLLARYPEEDSTGQNIRSYILSLMKELTKDIQFVKSTRNNKPMNENERVSILKWACNIGDNDCVEKSIELFKAFKKDASVPMDTNSKVVAFCTAIRHGNKEDWNFLWNKYKSSKDHSEHAIILKALGCSNDMAILRNYINMSISDAINDENISSVISAVYTGSCKGVNIALSFININYNKIKLKFGNMKALGELIKGLTDYLNTGKQIKSFENFLKEHSEDLMSIKDLDFALQRAKQNVHWVNNYSASVIKYMTMKGSN